MNEVKLNRALTYFVKNHDYKGGRLVSPRRCLICRARSLFSRTRAHGMCENLKVYGHGQTMGYSAMPVHPVSRIFRLLAVE